MAHFQFRKHYVRFYQPEVTGKEKNERNRQSKVTDIDTRKKIFCKPEVAQSVTQTS